MSHLLNAAPLLAGAAVGALLAGLFVALVSASLTDGATTAMPLLINCVAAGSLVAKCVLR